MFMDFVTDLMDLLADRNLRLCAVNSGNEIERL